MHFYLPAHPVLLFLTPAGFPHHKHRRLKMDEAFLTVKNELDTEVVVSWVSEHCYQVGSPQMFCCQKINPTNISSILLRKITMT